MTSVAGCFPEGRLANLKLDPPNSVLILKPSSFGDIIHTLPAVARLKSAWPSSRLIWLANPEWVPLLEKNSDLDSIVTFPRREFRGWAGPWKFYRWQREHIQRTRPDLVLDFQGLLRSALVGRLSAPQAFYGLSDAREGARWFYDRVTPIPGDVTHSVRRYLALAHFALKQQDLGYVPPSVPLRFPLPVGEPLDTDHATELREDYVLLHPFSRGEAKSLTIMQVEEFCRRLAPRQVVLIGRRPEGTGRPPGCCLDLLGRTTLRQLISIIRRAAFVISVDSGPAHLAAALERPMVAIHTWSDPRRVGPYRPDAWVWKSGELLRMQDLDMKPPAFFRARPSELTPSHIGKICALATLPSGFYA